MPGWINRTVLTGSSVAENGTNSHTCTFTAATSGNFLVAVVGGSVTFTTPSGWTLVVSAVNNCGLYVFTKTASSGQSSFSTTHNGSNYAIQGVIYEYGAGTSSIGSNSATVLSPGVQSGPQVTSLTGTYTEFSARTQNITNGTTIVSCDWTLPATEDYDVNPTKGSNDCAYLTIAYDDSQTGSSFNPSANIPSNTGTTIEAVAFALSLPAVTTAEVATTPVTSVTATTAQGNGAVNADGGATVTERGFVWSTSPNPTTADNKVTAAGTTGSYNASLTGLSSGTLYHVRAYATNSAGTSYGIDVTFRNLGASINWVKAA